MILLDIELLRSKYRIISNLTGCLPSNPLQNLERSLPALLSYEQLLVLLTQTPSTIPFKIRLEQIGKKKQLYVKDINEFEDLEELVRLLPEAPKELLLPLDKLRNSNKFWVYLALYQQSFFITSGQKFGGDYLLYYGNLILKFSLI